jgi:hypothetical protein
MVVCNLGGTLTYLNMWHLFHGLLRLQVADITQAPADATGLVDPTKWVVVVKTRGCPKLLAGKTRSRGTTKTCGSITQHSRVNLRAPAATTPTTRRESAPT